MRIASVNLLHGVDVRRLTSSQDPPSAQHVDLDAAAAWIAGLDVDVVVLQEVDSCLERSGGTDQVAELADRLGCQGVFGPALAGDPDRTWDEVPDDGLPDGAGGYGVGVLSRIGLTDVRVHRLPHGGAGTRVGRTGPTGMGVDTEPRVALSATVGDGLRVTTTHLSYMFWRAVPQLRAALAAARWDGPSVLLGDINLPLWAGGVIVRSRFSPAGWMPGSDPADGWRQLSGGATYPAWSPRLQLDHAYVPHLPKPAAVAVGPRGPSDHLPLLLAL